MAAESELDFASALVGLLAQDLATNSPQLFAWRERFFLVLGVNPELGTIDSQSALLGGQERALLSTLAAVLLCVEPERFSFSQAQALASKALKGSQEMRARQQKKPVIAHSGKLILRSDGASRGNPGQAAIAFVLLSEDEAVTLGSGSEYLGVSTNNQAEYKGLILGLEFVSSLSAKPSALLIQADSELMIKQLRGEYKVKDLTLANLKNKASGLLGGLGFPYKLEHIRREKNKLADALCNECLDGRG